MLIKRIGLHNDNLQRYWSIAECWMDTAGAEKILTTLPFEYAYIHQCGRYPTRPGHHDIFDDSYRAGFDVYTPDLSIVDRRVVENIAQIVKEAVSTAGVIEAKGKFILEAWATAVPFDKLREKPELLPTDLKPRLRLLKGSIHFADLERDIPWFHTTF